MRITGLYARNVGDGRFVELSWSSVSPTNVRHFILERWERHKKKWVPYDDFHGIVPHQTTELDENPPQKLMVEVLDHAPSQQSFRIKAVGWDGSETDWSTTSVEFTSRDARVGDDRIWYVEAGLGANQISDTEVEVQPGAAVCAGQSYFVNAPIILSLPEEAASAMYVVYINRDGIIGISADPTMPFMRLAHVFVDAEGKIFRIVDVRFLWAPANFEADWRMDRQSVFVTATWTPFWEVNLKGWVVARAEGAGEHEELYENLDVLADDISIFIDRRVGNNETYTYRIAAVDWNDNLSPWSEPITVEIESDIIPDAPTGVAGSVTGSAFGVQHIIRWDPHSDHRVVKFWVYREMVVGETTHWVFLGQSTANEYVVSPVLDPTRSHRYYVTAVTSQDIESLPSEIITIEPGKIAVKPKAPMWRQKAFETTNNVQDPDGSITYFFWNPVTQKEDNSPADDLAGYAIYRVELDGEEKNYILEVTAGPDETQAVATSLAWGHLYTFVIAATDIWGNVSDYSSEITFVAGDDRIPLPPELLSAVNVPDPSAKIKLEWTNPDKDTKNRPLTNIEAIEIWRGLAKIHEVGLGATSWIDASVDKSVQYEYKLRARTDTGNLSDFSNAISVVAGAIDLPPPPVWDSQEPLSSSVEQGPEIINTLRFSLPDPGTAGPIRGVYILHGRSLHSLEEIAFVPNDGSGDFIFEHGARQNGSRDYYALIAQADSGRRSALSVVKWIDAGDVTPPFAPSVSSEPLWQNGQAGVKLSWQSQEDVVRYEVHRSSFGPNLRFSLHDSLDAPGDDSFTFVFEDLDLVNGKSYYYRIIAINALGVPSDPALVHEVAGDTTPPANVEGVAVSLAFDPLRPHAGKVNLSWQPVQDSSSYRIFYSLDGMWFHFLADAETESFTDERPYGSTVVYKIHALDEAMNQSGGVNVSVSFTKEQDPDPPASVSIDFEASSLGLVDARISWSYDPGDDFARYLIFAGLDGEPLELAGDVSAKEVKSFRIPGFVPGQTYVFGVRVQDVWGGLSDLVSATVLAQDDRVPARVENVSATPRPGAIELRWDMVRTKEDGSPLFNLKGYRIQGSKEDDFSVIELDAFSAAPAYLHHASKDDVWYYRIQAVDLEDQESVWSDAAGPVSALALVADFVGVSEPPDAPLWADPSHNSALSGPKEFPHRRQAYIELFWQPVPGAHQYFIYRKDADLTYRIGASKTPYFRWDGVVPGASYTVYVTAAAVASEESDPSDDLIVTAAFDDHAPQAPVSEGIVQGFGVLAPRWKLAVDAQGNIIDPDIVAFELEYRTSQAPPETPQRSWSDWTPLPDAGRASHYLHVSLEYETYYAYRVRAVNAGGFKSPWTYIEPQDGLRPNQGTSADLAAASILTLHLAADSVDTFHLKSGSIETRHLKSRIVQGEHLDFKSIKTEHLDISIGGDNLIRNSAFGLRNLSGDLGVDWELEGDAEIIEDGHSPVGAFALKLIDGSSASQEIEVEEAADYTLSAYMRLEDAKEDGLSFEVVLAEDESVVLWSESFAGTFPYGRIERHITLPSDAIRIKISLEGDGEAYVTGLQLEPGEMVSPWRPKNGELYGAFGSVQISTDGIRIADGKLRIVTGQDQLVIDHEGITALHGSGKSTRLDHSGLALSGGSFVISTGDPANPSNAVVLDGDGLRAYSASTKSVDIDTSGKLSVFGGSFEISTAAEGSASSRLVIDGQGIRSYSGTQENVNLTASGSLTLRRGSFTIFTGASAYSMSSLTLDASGITSIDASGNATFKLKSEGSLELTSSFLIRSQISGARLEMDAQSLRSFDGANTLPRYELKSDGTAVFRDGSLTVTSEDGGVILDGEGLKGFSITNEPIFSLTREGGLTISNEATITLGSVVINPSGITIAGSLGLVVQTSGPAPDDMIRINSDGIALLAGNTIQVKQDGKIIFEPVFGDVQTAIDRTGIKASAITAGTLTITPHHSSPSIKVIDEYDNERVTIDARGIIIEDGALTLRGPDGRTVIDNGVIQTGVLQVGAGSINRVRNGRADFGTESWSISEGLSVSSENHIPENPFIMSAGVSGPRSFRIQGAGSLKMSQWLDGQFLGLCRISAWVYVHQGKIRLEVYGAENESGAPVVLESTSVQTGWERLTGTFYSQGYVAGGDPTGIALEVYTEGDTIAYITDITVTEGPGEMGFSPHPSELESANGSVRISDEGVRIINAALDVKTASSAVHLNSEGLHGYKDSTKVFELGQQGLSLSFPEENITLTKEGIRAGTQSKYALLHSEGLEIKGGAFDIRSAGDRIVIDSSQILVKKTEQSWIKISAANGFQAFGDSASIDLINPSTNLRAVFDTEGVKMYRPGRGMPSAHLGFIGKLLPSRATRSEVGPFDFTGLYIEDGAFYLSGGSGKTNVFILPYEIRIEDNEEGTASIWNSSRIQFVTEDGTARPYLQHVEAGLVELDPNTGIAKVNFSSPFRSYESPKVILSITNAEYTTNRYVRGVSYRLTGSGGVASGIEIKGEYMTASKWVNGSPATMSSISPGSYTWVSKIYGVARIYVRAQLQAAGYGLWSSSSASVSIKYRKLGDASWSGVVRSGSVSSSNNWRYSTVTFDHYVPLGDYEVQLYFSGSGRKKYAWVDKCGGYEYAPAPGGFNDFQVSYMVVS